MTDDTPRSDNPPSFSAGAGGAGTSPTSVASATVTSSASSTPTPTTNVNADAKGKAGRTDYAAWDSLTTDLTRSLEDEESADRAASSAALGLDGRHASSAAEAEELRKAAEARRRGEAIEGYRRREAAVVQTLADLLEGAPERKCADSGETTRTRFVTRDMIGAGRRVVALTDTTGPGRVVLTTDLSELVSAVRVNAALTPRSYEGDSENSTAEEKYDGSGGAAPGTRDVRGLIKLSLTNLEDCTVVVRCKIITRTIEISHCRNLTLRIEREATAATVQADLCSGLTVEFRDAPSGKDPAEGGATLAFWGEDNNDRVYHAGVSELTVRTFRDGYVESECKADYEKLGAEAVGNATKEEVQFVSSVVGGELVTEKVVRSNGASPGGGGGSARPMTEREHEEERRKQERKMKAFEGMVRIVNKDGQQNGSALAAVASSAAATPAAPADDDGVEEVYAGITQDRIDAIVGQCEAQKTQGNDAFRAGEYAQAVLYYSLALDKAAELPDEGDVEAATVATPSGGRGGGGKEKVKSVVKQLFPRHVVLSNRSASFLKLGEHQKALSDAEKAYALDPTYVKGAFRRGLALHAMGRYGEAAPALGEALKIEPKNKQIQQALKFAEMRAQQEMRKRMEGL